MPMISASGCSSARTSFSCDLRFNFGSGNLTEIYRPDASTSSNVEDSVELLRKWAEVQLVLKGQ